MNTPATHPREEEAAAYVFGLMEPAERAAFERDLETDALLRQVTEELAETAAALSLSVPQSAPPPALKSRVLESVKALPQERKTKPATIAPARRGGSFAGWALAAGFAVLCVVLWDKVKTSEQTLVLNAAKLAQEKAWVTKTEALMAESRAQNDTLKTSLAHAESAAKDLQESMAKITSAAAVLKQELASTTQAKAALEQANKALEAEKALVVKSRELDKMQIATLKSTIADYKQGVAVVVWDSAKQEGILKLERMPPVDANKDYQLWVVDSSKKKPVSAGVVRVDPKGFAKVQFKPNLDIQQADKFALSVEKRVSDPAGVPVGAGPIVLLSP